MGLADYLGWDWKSSAGIPIVCVPGCPVQPDNFTEVLLYLLNMAAGRAPLIPLDVAAYLVVWLYGSRGMRPRGILRAGAIRRRIWSLDLHREIGMLGSGGAVQCRKARMDERNRGMSQHRGHLRRVHHAGLSG
jgi:hypothetical protein